MEPRGSGMCPEEERRADQGWVRAGLAVLVAGVLGGGVLVAAGGGTGQPRQLKADGVAGASTASAVEAEALRPPEAAKADPVVGDKVEMGDDGGSVTVAAVEDNVSAGRLFGAGEGQKYVATEVKGCSGPNEKNITFEPGFFLLRLDDGTIRDAGVGAKKPSLEGGTIPPGKCLSGWVTFPVPDGALPTAVIYDGSSRTTWTVPLPADAKPTTTTTAKKGATTSTTGDVDPEASDTTSTTRAAASTTSTTKAKSTATTARSTATTAKSGSTTTTKPAPMTAPTGKSSSTTTSTTAKVGSGSTSTTEKAGAADRSGSGSTTTTRESGATSTPGNG